MFLLNHGSDAPHSLCRQGTTLEYHRLPWQEPDVPYALPVLYEDEHILAVSKPSGLQVLPGGPFHQRTALTLLQWWYTRGGVTPAPVHRLGRGTSGVLLCAKTPQARAALAADFAEVTMGRTNPALETESIMCDGVGPVGGPLAPSSASKKRIAKTYRALVQGLIPEDYLDVNQPIGRIKHGGVRGGLHAASPNGKHSRSRIRVIWRDIEKEEQGPRKSSRALKEKTKGWPLVSLGWERIRKKAGIRERRRLNIVRRSGEESLVSRGRPSLAATKSKEILIWKTTGGIAKGLYPCLEIADIFFTLCDWRSITLSPTRDL
ncbi:hypothetical protein KFL_004120180 [Klebsormidium nitens]|uniref:Pseudouridine synthase RsuA/RluA-like domain-containing protein n=1 Tax=Klebsormidium nitens TaxID=105231 RepID=A0A1Y1IBF7_KLENI|nr:hypothetical protein KFL_004120180 [Klebsormidium nitens]|eukprot:GAQ88250.1 hypothetical protein KFL_004120180 [Klebsormidium nitens]